jgi:hypothetical protein
MAEHYSHGKHAVTRRFAKGFPSGNFEPRPLVEPYKGMREEEAMNRKLWLGGVALVLLLAACNQVRSTGGEETGFAPQPADRAAGEEAKGLLPDEAEGGAVTGGPVVGAALPQIGPNVIKTADLRVEVRRSTLRDAVGEVTAIAGRHGGFVLSTQVAGAKARSGLLVIRVPAERFEVALAEIRELGTKVLGETVAGEDVGQEFIDLEARLRNWRAQEVVLLRLMDRAQSVTDTIRVQRELQQVQLEIEQIRGRLRYLEDQTRMSTITVGLREAGVAAPGQPSTLERAWDRAVQSFLAIVSGAIVAAGALLPFALLVLAGWVVFRAVRPRLGMTGTGRSS